MPSEFSIDTKRIFYGILITITCLSFVLRIISIDHDLPYQIIVDEGSDLTTAVRLLQGHWPERHVRYHRSLIAYNNLIPIAAVGLINVIDGDVRSISDFQNLYFSNRAEFTYATRVWMACLTSTAIFFTGLAGAYLNSRIGLLAALLLALNAFFFHTSLYALPDALGASMTAFALWSLIRLAQFGRTRDYILASIALALVMLAKLHAATIGIGVLVAHGYWIYRQANSDWRRFVPAYIFSKNLWIAALIGILGNLLLNPIAFVNLNDLFFEINRMNTVVYVDQSDNLLFKLSMIQKELQNLVLVIWRFSLPLGFLGFWQIWQKRQNHLYIMVFSMFTLLFLVTLSSRLGPISHFYYWNPWGVLMSLLSAIGLFGLWEWFSQSKRQFLFWFIFIFVIILEGGFFVKMLAIMNNATTQELAREYVINNIPSDSKIMAPDTLILGVSLYRNRESLERVRDVSGSLIPQWDWLLKQSDELFPSPSYDIFGPEMAVNINSFEDQSALIESNSIDYFILTDYCDGAHADPSSESVNSYPFYSDNLVANWELIAEYSPFDSGGCASLIHDRTKLSFNENIYQQNRLGPYIRIYRIPN